MANEPGVDFIEINVRQVIDIARLVCAYLAQAGIKSDPTTQLALVYVVVNQMLYHGQGKIAMALNLGQMLSTSLELSGDGAPPEACGMDIYQVKKEGN